MALKLTFKRTKLLLDEREKMKLEELLGADLYAQVQAKIDDANKDETDKLKHVRFIDLSEGGYVAKAKHADLESKFATKESELASANELIEQLKNGTEGNAELQGKISAYETKVAELQAELAETKLKLAIKVALMTAGASDIDYISYKLNENLKKKGKKLELDDNGSIKDWNGELEELKTQFPAWFDKEEGYTLLNPKGLPAGGKEESVTKEQYLKMSYEQRITLKSKNPKLYEKLSK